MMDYMSRVKAFIIDLIAEFNKKIQYKYILYKK